MNVQAPDTHVPTAKISALDVLTLPGQDYDPDSIFQLVEDDNFNNGDRRFIALLENIGGKQNRLHGHAA